MPEDDAPDATESGESEPAADTGPADREPPHDSAHRWFLTPEERGNPAANVDRRHRTGRAWTAGNLVQPLVHGEEYFARLYEELSGLGAGDRVYFTDWRGDPDEKLRPDGPSIGDLLCDRARAGVEVRALLWRSHSDLTSFSGAENQHFGTELNEAGAEVLLDQRLRRFGAHHQKLFVIRHRDDPDRDVAFVGGIDLCHSRRDDAVHAGDPQPLLIDNRYGDTPPWHDAALELHGPVVGDVLETFTERWDDPTPLDRRTPYRMVLQRLAHMPRHPRKLPERFADPEPAGPHAVQVLRTYARKWPRYPFAPRGERSVARAYEKAFDQARSLIYLEDQYLWSPLVARGLAEALARYPQLRLIAVVPRFPDADGAVTGPPNRLGQLRAMRMLQDTAPDRVAIYDLENDAGTPVYVHSKICIIDDVWFTCGSDNFNRRSWTNDSEVTCAVVDPTHDEREPRDPGGLGDGARRVPRDLRLRMWGEHLGRPVDDPALLDPVDALELWRSTAAALDAWYAGGGIGPRPPGQIRPHRPKRVSALQEVWADPMYRFVFDPDGRPTWMRFSPRF